MDTVKESPFRRIAGSRAFEEVVDQITMAIRAGIYRPNDRLPRIEDLSQSLGVSKPTVVEALRVLSSAGVLATQRGATGGVTVLKTEIPPTLLALSRRRQATLHDLLEARRPIEMELAQLCGQRAMEEDFELLEEAIRLLIANKDGDPSGIVYSDHLFHYGVGRIARSEVLAQLQGEVIEQLATLAQEPGFRVDTRTGIADHRRTLVALRSRDPEAINQAMDRHLRVRERMAGSLGLGQPNGKSRIGVDIPRAAPKRAPVSAMPLRPSSPSRAR